MSCNLMKLKRPSLYEDGNITLWSNEYIAFNVLKKHLDTEQDSGTRKISNVIKCCNWLKETFHNKKEILDIGCGPGIYAKFLCESGFAYDGIDVSPYQIAYAQKHNVNVSGAKFDVCDFRNWYGEKQYDMVLILYGLYGMYSNNERLALLKKVKQSLKPGGCVIVEVFTKYHYLGRNEDSDWEYIEKDGFWSKEAYLELNAFYRYEEANVTLVQAAIIKDEVYVWNAWNQVYTVDSIREEFKKAGFTDFKIYGSCAGEVYTLRSEVICLCAFSGD